MNISRHASRLAALAALLLLLAAPRTARAAAPVSVIPVTGQLLIGGSPATGNYDLQFQLYTAATGGTAFGPLVTVTNVAVEDGVFYAEVDFGNLNYGNPLYVQTSYRRAGTGTYTALTPRHVAPTAIYAANANYASASGNTYRLQGTSVSATAPTANQALVYSGTAWAPGRVGASSLALPLALSASSSSPILSVANTDSNAGDAIDAASVNGYGVSVSSVNGYAVNASSSAGDGVVASGEHFGLYGSGGGYGAYGSNSASGDYGFLGGTEPFSGSSTPAGVFGNDSTGSSGGGGGYGVYGHSVNGVGGYFSSGGVNSLYAVSAVTDGNGIQGESDTGTNAYGVEGYSASGIGVYGYGRTYAGDFGGDVNVTGTLTAGAKNFKIDDPLDPAGRYLSHASIESDRMEDIYNGHVTLDADGAATVTLPAWFQSLNTDFEYTLTCIGGFAPVYVSSEVAHNTFGIAGGRPGMKVSWQVTGVRHDAYALAHPLQVEQDKPEAEKGLYQNPDAFGLPDSAGIGYAKRRGHPRPAPPTAQP